MVEPPATHRTPARISSVREFASLLLSTTPLAAIPNTIFEPLAAVHGPLNGVDLTEEMIAAVGRGQIAAPRGEWKEEGAIGNAAMAHLLARSPARGGKLESIEATLADAGSYFGYSLPGSSGPVHSGPHETTRCAPDTGRLLLRPAGGLLDTRPTRGSATPAYRGSRGRSARVAKGAWSGGSPRAPGCTSARNRCQGWLV